MRVTEAPLWWALSFAWRATCRNSMRSPHGGRMYVPPLRRTKRMVVGGIKNNDGRCGGRRGGGGGLDDDDNDNATMLTTLRALATPRMALPSVDSSKDGTYPLRRSYFSASSSPSLLTAKRVRYGGFDEKFSGEEEEENSSYDDNEEEGCPVDYSSSSSPFHSGIVPFLCPDEADRKRMIAMNDKPGDFDLYFQDNEAKLKMRTSLSLSSSLTNGPSPRLPLSSLLGDIRHTPYDAWGPTPITSKERLRPWKVEAFGPPHLKSGDSIYESACGQGLNLLLTAEILEEECSVRHLTVYGNDYLRQSVDIAHAIWDAVEVASDDQTGARKGRFCVADSADLGGFVPSNSFDLVFTGYIAPLIDPLGLLPPPTSSSSSSSSSTNLPSSDSPSGRSMKERVYNSWTNCRSEDPYVRALSRLEQSWQEWWYAQWVREMIRIAKPGKVVAVEMNAESLCKSGGDFGGVDKGWWEEAVREYGWDVDPTSIVIRDVDAIGEWPGGRYHIMMRKNGGA